MFLVVVLFIYLPDAKSQRSITLSFKDSVNLTEGSNIVNNDLLLVNTSGSQQNVTIRLFAPPLWQLVGSDSIVVKLMPNETKVTPLNLIRTPLSLASWQAFGIHIKDSKGDVYRDSFFVRAPSVYKFALTTENQEIIIRDNTKKVEIDFAIANKGNTTESFSIAARNDFFYLSKMYQLSLKPGEEKKISIPLRITPIMRKSIKSKYIDVNAAGQHDKTNKLRFTFSRLSSHVLKNEFAYDVIPIELEAGIFWADNQSSYYTGISGGAKTKKGEDIRFSYRTKQLGIANTIESNVFSLEYKYKRWSVYAGALSDINSFFAFGQGLSITYKGKNQQESNFTTIFNYRRSIFKNDLVSGYHKYKIKGIGLKHTMAVNVDPVEKKGSLLLSNEVSLIDKNDKMVKLNFGVGQDHYMLKLPGMPKEVAGTLLGYNVLYRLKKIELSSDFLLAGNYYPGFNKGALIHNHTIRTFFKNFSVGLFYQYNKTKGYNYIFRDTVYNSDFFNFDVERYGVSLSTVVGKVSLLTSAGYFRQTLNASNSLPSYRFLELSSTYRISKFTSIILNSFNGFGAGRTFKDKQVWISSTSAAINSRHGGISAFYVRMPNSGFGNNRDTTNLVRETMNIRPYINLLFFKKLRINTGLNFSKSLFDNSVMIFNNMNISYIDLLSGWDISLMGNVPITSSNPDFSSLANNNVLLTVKKKLNLPVFFKRKFYDFKVVLFIDENLNNRKEATEIPLRDVVIKIGEDQLITSNAGIATYSNVEKKLYAIDLSKVYAPRGYIPKEGTLQFAQVAGNTVLEIPYQKGKVIAGKVDVILDSLSSMSLPFKAERIKVMVTDSSGNYYSTLTDSKGEYFINVPAGKYRVFLNEEAFTKEVRPVEMSFNVELGMTADEVVVNFEIRQKTRKVRFLNN